MNLILTYVLYFLVGVVQDLFITSYYQAISQKAPVKSATLSTVVTIVNLTVLYSILANIQDQALPIIFVYALGNGLGTYLVVKRDKK